MPTTETLHHSIILLISCGESSGWPTGRILYRVELICFLRLGYLGLGGHGTLCLQTLEALFLHLVVLHEFVCSDVVRAFLLLYVLANLFEGLCYSSVHLIDSKYESIMLFKFHFCGFRAHRKSANCCNHCENGPSDLG